ncbi:sodium:alanine symporter family protein [Virgibacillus sp. 179-BFC.A HS]|uniref:Sodium:alanine symporter family protein n=1 Tax=Tigheibacillus jepli TaxID=3035914 RepID=A0ABU5CH36_9BACI|nr:sodium:alanine symporter family protein [Virgibacillus sp. 179-BFC.A HS]MDY0405149.1 sodium:alanine symporter family protein [Virgibacillus sp. 179-BFC.A HS]
MAAFESIVSHVSDFLMTYIVSVLLIFTGILYTFRLKFFQFLHFPHVLKNTIGAMFRRHGSKGTITPFQAFASTLGTTAGATNIVGVAVAIALGGPGALFWMWVVALIGMATKYAEIVLGLKYREQNKEGEWVGGPMYYIKKGLGWKKLASLFAFFLMIEIFSSTMVQSNSIATQMESAFGFNKAIIGIVLVILVGIIVIGGIKRVSKVTDKLVPFMILTYIVTTLTVIIYNYDQVPAMFALIFKHAFTPISATGGFAGAGIAGALRWGLARGLYSNEAGIGTAPFAHAAAQTDHPSKQALWGMLSVFTDTIVICTLSGFAVLSTGAWHDVGPSKASSMVDVALSTVMGDFYGSLFVTIFLFLFVITTVMVIIFYGEKQVEYLFGIKAAKGSRFVYLAAVFIGSIGGLQFIWQFLDILLAVVTLINLVPLLLLNKEVRDITNDYVDRFIKQRNNVPHVRLFTDQKKAE